MKRSSIQLVALLVYAVALAVYQASPATAEARNPATLSGSVRDRHGVPQAGAAVQLLRADSSLAAEVYTSSQGRYQIAGVQPGTYSLKAIGTSFLPVLREHLLIRSSMVVNLTLSTLFEAAEWMPIQRRSPDERQDDWTWTLRTAANRPLLRMLEDGPLVVVSEDATHSRLKARVTTSSPAREFGMGGIRNAFELRSSEEGDRELILRAGTAGPQGADLAVGYRRTTITGATLRTSLELAQLPGIEESEGAAQVRAIVSRGSESFELGPGAIAEFGSEIAAIPEGELLVATNPFGSLEWQGSSTRIAYRVAESPTMTRADEVGTGARLMDTLGMRNGHLTLAHGLHQEIDLARRLGASEIEVTFYRENLIDQPITAAGSLSSAELSTGSAIQDPATGLVRFAGPSMNGYGVLAAFEQQMGHNLMLRMSAGEGQSVAVGRVAPGSSFEDALAAMHAVEAPVASLSLRGNLRRTRSSLGASYRWQPQSTLAPVAVFSAQNQDAYLCFTLRQSLGAWGPMAEHVEMLVDVQNLLAEGYRPFVTSDGRTLYFAQAQRFIRGGLAFTF